MLDERGPKGVHPTGVGFPTEGRQEAVSRIDDSDFRTVEWGLFEKLLAEIGTVNAATDDDTLERIAWRLCSHWVASSVSLGRRINNNTYPNNKKYLRAGIC